MTDYIDHMPLLSCDTQDRYAAAAEARKARERAAKVALRQSEAEHIARLRGPQPSPADIDAQIRQHVVEGGRVVGELLSQRDAKIKQLESKLDAVDERSRHAVNAPGKLPQIRLWKPETVHYAGELVSHAGALWQSRADTAQRPSTNSTEWVMVVRAPLDGLDGPPGRDGETGAQGPRGNKGDKGAKGDRGEQGADGATIVSWQIDKERYCASPLMSNGVVGPTLELRSLFEQFLSESDG